MTTYRITPIRLAPSDPEPPDAHLFPSLGAWLAAMNPRTVLRVTPDDGGPTQLTTPAELAAELREVRPAPRVRPVRVRA